MNEIFILIQDITAVIFKFYKSTNTQSWVELTQAERDALSGPFIPIYEQFDVKLIGFWYDKYNRNIAYFMNAYRDEEHYEQFIKGMKTHNDYQIATKNYSPYVEKIEAATLNLDSRLSRHVDLVDYVDYINQAKSAADEFTSAVS